MKTVKVQLRLPEDLRDAAAHQAAQRGVSLNLFLATAVAARVGAKAEAQRHLTARGSRTTPQRARALLQQMGTPGMLRKEDRLDAPDEPSG